MSDPRRSAPFYMTATTQFGLEEVLADELRQLGADIEKVGQRAVEFVGDLRLCYAANLWSRTAIRILRPFAGFYARDEKQLYREVGRVNWYEYIRPGQTFAITAVVNKSSFEHSLYVAQLTKDAIVDQFRARTGGRPDVDVKNPDIRLHLHMLENEVVLSLDSSGESLHRRGYRQHTNEAPLNEALAAGILHLAGFDGRQTLVDPMCGSGTLLIEAALLAQRIAPGLYHQGKFSFENWPDFDRALWADVRHAAEQARLSEPQAQLVGSDLSADTIELARLNLEAAGVEKFVELAVRDVRDAQAPAGAPGLVVTNPPYGERIGEEAEMEALYKTLGDTFKTHFQGYDAYVLTGNLDAAKRVGLKAARRIPLYNGPIECRLLKYELYQGSRRGQPASSFPEKTKQGNARPPVSVPSAYAPTRGTAPREAANDGEAREVAAAPAAAEQSAASQAEQALWRELRGQRLGAKFRRQHALGDYTVDFASIGAKLIVEIDETGDETGSRSQALRKLGYQVVRFPNEQVLNALPHVLAEIKRHLPASSSEE